MISALYIDPRGPYPKIPGVDCWDEKLDARKYDGPHPVVAHPPCGPWGRLRHLYRGAEHDCAPRAVEQVRRWGGVLEHPAGSKLWEHCGLPTPRDNAPLGLWRVTHKGDPIAAALADRHYSRRKVGSPQFMPPGQTLVLVRDDGAVFGWWRPHPRSGIKAMNGLDGWTCSIFRREPTCAELASDLILDAERELAARFDCGPSGLITYVFDAKVASENPGYCFKKAGYRAGGRSADGKKALLRKRFEDAGVLNVVGGSRSLERNDYAKLGLGSRNSCSGSYSERYRAVSLTDAFGGYTIEIDQVDWGHVARKRTWLYLVGVPREALEAPPFPGREPTHWVSGGRGRVGKKAKTTPVPPGIKICSAQQRRRTPPLFAEYLVRLAGSVVL